MLKLNTVLTAMGVILLGVLGWLGNGIWTDVAAIKTSNTASAAHIEVMSHELDDHETRIRQTEKDVTILQQRERETFRAPHNQNQP